MKKPKRLFFWLLGSVFLLLYGACLCLWRTAPWLALIGAVLATLLLAGLLVLRAVSLRP